MFPLHSPAASDRFPGIGYARTAPSPNTHPPWASCSRTAASARIWKSRTVPSPFTPSGCRNVQASRHPYHIRAFFSPNSGRCRSPGKPSSGRFAFQPSREAPSRARGACDSRIALPAAEFPLVSRRARRPHPACKALCDCSNTEHIPEQRSIWLRIERQLFPERQRRRPSSRNDHGDRCRPSVVPTKAGRARSHSSSHPRGGARKSTLGCITRYYVSGGVQRRPAPADRA
ncbi:MAG: hypothetical protein HLUCCA24_01450 [Rhodobacteraceae bacterium HLUCCA24]|nr:MAG: hypothetical protein HLUCCA24_01450 [Rhodobacteraceae bacterium HLUCCA24]